MLHKNKTLALEITPDMFMAIKAAASFENMHMRDWIIYLIEEELARLAALEERIGKYKDTVGAAQAPY